MTGLTAARSTRWSGPSSPTRRAGPAGLLERWGSPLNVLFPEIFAANVAGFRDELDASGLRYRICYAHKANQARAFVRAALAAGIGIDVASPGELRSALAAGFPAGRIEATGPKGRDFLGVLAGSGVTVNVDNLWELGELIGLARAAGHRVPVLVRMCGFGPVPRAAEPVRRAAGPLRGGHRPAAPRPGRGGLPRPVLPPGLQRGWATRCGPSTSACGCSSGPGRPGSARGSWTSAAASARPSPTRRQAFDEYVPGRQARPDRARARR